MQVFKFPLKSIKPIAPEKIPLLSFSNSLIISIALIFGAPETVPAGKPLFKASKMFLSFISFPLTSETICITCEYISIFIFSLILTLSNSETLPTSFLPKSSNIKCSANSFLSFNKS